MIFGAEIADRLAPVKIDKPKRAKKHSFEARFGSLQLPYAATSRFNAYHGAVTQWLLYYNRDSKSMKNAKVFS